jgi:hypothetical protein
MSCAAAAAAAGACLQKGGADMALVAVRCGECGHRGFCPSMGFPRVLRCAVCNHVHVATGPTSWHAIRGNRDDDDVDQAAETVDHTVR